MHSIFIDQIREMCKLSETSVHSEFNKTKGDIQSFQQNCMRHLYSLFIDGVQLKRDNKWNVCEHSFN